MPRTHPTSHNPPVKHWLLLLSYSSETWGINGCTNLSSLHGKLDFNAKQSKRKMRQDCKPGTVCPLWQHASPWPAWFSARSEGRDVGVPEGYSAVQRLMYCSWMDWTFEIRCWPWKGWGREFLTFECGEGAKRALLSPRFRCLSYFLRALWWEMASWESLDLLQQKTWPWHTNKKHLKGFKCIPILCEQPARVGMD